MTVALVGIVSVGVGVAASIGRALAVRRAGRKDELAEAVSGAFALALCESALVWSDVGHTRPHTGTAAAQAVLYAASFVLLVFCIGAWLRRARHFVGSPVGTARDAEEPLPSPDKISARPKAVFVNLFLVSFVGFAVANCVSAPLWVICVADGALLMFSGIVLAHTLPRLFWGIKMRSS